MNLLRDRNVDFYIMEKSKAKFELFAESYKKT